MSASTPNNTATYTTTVTRTKTPTKTTGPSSTPTITRTKTPTTTITKTPTITQTRTRTPTNTSYAPTKTYTPTISPTVTNTVTRTPTQTYTVTPTSIAPSGQVWKFYYYVGSTRIAERETSQFVNLVYYLFSDHLGSTNVVSNTNGEMVSLELYKAWGESRYEAGANLTDYGYTGQREDVGIGLYYYNARWFDPELGRFVQADTIVPSSGNPAAFDRYEYVLNNPINGIDPSGNTTIGKNCNSMIDGAYCSTNSGVKSNNSSSPSVTKKYTVSDYKRMIKEKYGITLAGNWSLISSQVAFNGLNTLNNILNGRLIDFSWGNTFYMEFNERYYGGKANPSGDIIFHSPGAIPYQTFYHEVTHMIDYEAGDFFTTRLNSTTVRTTSGSYVMGGSPYNRNSLGYAQKKLDDPNYGEASVYAEQHSNSICTIPSWCEEGNTANEEWGDLLANYTSNNFIVDETKTNYDYGITRFNWVRSIINNYLNTTKP